MMINDNDDCDVGGNFDSDSVEEALAISAHPVNPIKYLVHKNLFQPDKS